MYTNAHILIYIHTHTYIHMQCIYIIAFYNYPLWLNKYLNVLMSNFNYFVIVLHLYFNMMVKCVCFKITDSFYNSLASQLSIHHINHHHYHDPMMGSKTHMTLICVHLVLAWCLFLIYHLKLSQCIHVHYTPMFL